MISTHRLCLGLAVAAASACGNGDDGSANGPPAPARIVEEEALVGPISGVVRASDGSPMPNTLLRVGRRGRVIVADSDGRFTLDDPGPRYDLTLRVGEGQQVYQFRGLKRRDPTLHLAYTSPAKFGADTFVLDGTAALTPAPAAGAALTGKVVAFSGTRIFASRDFNSDGKTYYAACAAPLGSRTPTLVAAILSATTPDKEPAFFFGQVDGPALPIADTSAPVKVAPIQATLRPTAKTVLRIITEEGHALAGYTTSPPATPITLSAALAVGEGVAVPVEGALDVPNQSAVVRGPRVDGSPFVVTLTAMDGRDGDRSVATTRWLSPQDSASIDVRAVTAPRTVDPPMGAKVPTQTRLSMAASHPGLNVMILQSGGRVASGPDVYVVTMDDAASIDLDDEWMGPRPRGSTVEWMVQTLGPYTSVDDAAGQATFLASDGLPSMSGRLTEARFFATRSLRSWFVVD